MDLFEYQAKNLFERHGVPVLPGEVATTPEEARHVARRLGGTVVVKAQVKTGGRGKAGGVKLAQGQDDAFDKAQAILGMDIKGHTVHRVLVTAASDIDAEYYVSFLLDRANRTYLAMASVEGGMEIEQLAVERPRRAGPGPGRRDPGSGRREGRRDLRHRGLPRGRARPGDRRPAEAVGGVHGRGRDPRRGQPAGEDPRRAGRGPRRQGHPRRQRRLPAPGLRRPGGP